MTTDPRSDFKNLKRCTKCNHLLTLTRFYPERRRNGYRPVCISCNAEAQRNKPLHKQREYANRYRDAHRESVRQSERNRSKYRKTNHVPPPHKSRARNIASLAVKSGLLVKPNFCEACQRTVPLEKYHFMGYDHPIAVIWLCSICHGKAHRKYSPLRIQRAEALVNVIEEGNP